MTFRKLQVAFVGEYEPNFRLLFILFVRTLVLEGKKPLLYYSVKLFHN